MKNVVAGVDEVGRGSIIGPLYADAVILKRKIDRKKLLLELMRLAEGV